MKDWNNIKENKCPTCGSKLLFRKQGSNYNIKANKNFTKGNKSNIYFCSKCDGFQITEKRLLEIKNKMLAQELRILKDNPLLTTGILQAVKPYKPKPLSKKWRKYVDNSKTTE